MMNTSIIKNDIVYVLGSGSLWLNNEIRYSLRSVDKFLQNKGEVFVFGELPIFLDDKKLIHVPLIDISGDKALNIRNKLVAICNNPLVSENFMLFNDDYFLRSAIDANNYPYYYKCDLYNTMNINRTLYREHVIATINALESRELSLYNFDTHKPIIYNKKHLLEVINMYDWNIKHGYIMRSLYCNTVGVIGEFKLDSKINLPLSAKRWDEKTIGEDCFSIDDRALGAGLNEFMRATYPDPSCYERQTIHQ